MSKELHIWFNNDYPPETLTTYPETNYAIAERQEIVHTTQTSFANTSNLVQGYALYIHPFVGNTFEIKLGYNMPYSPRELRLGHNIENLLLGREFDIPNEMSVAYSIPGVENNNTKDATRNRAYRVYKQKRESLENTVAGLCEDLNTIIKTFPDIIDVNVDAPDSVTFTAHQPMKMPEKPKHAIAINSIGMSKRAVNCLLRNGVSTVEQLLERTPDEIHSMRNLGDVTYNEITSKLKELNLTFISEIRRIDNAANASRLFADAIDEANSNNKFKDAVGKLSVSGESIFVFDNDVRLLKTAITHFRNTVSETVTEFVSTKRMEMFFNSVEKRETS